MIVSFIALSITGFFSFNYADEILKERIGDQKFFVNNLSKIKKAVNWQPKVNVNKGINLFYTWIVNNFKNNKKKKKFKSAIQLLINTLQLILLQILPLIMMGL